MKVIGLTTMVTRSRLPRRWGESKYRQLRLLGLTQHLLTCLSILKLPLQIDVIGEKIRSVIDHVILDGLFSLIQD